MRIRGNGGQSDAVRALFAATAISAGVLGSLGWPSPVLAQGQEPATAAGETGEAGTGGDAGETAGNIPLLSTEAVESFKADPNSLLTAYADLTDADALAAIEAEVASLARTDPTTAAELVDLAAGAIPGVQTAIAQGLAAAALELQTVDPEAAQAIQTAVAGSGLESFIVAFTAATSDTATAATTPTGTPTGPAPAGPPGGAPIGGAGSAGGGTGTGIAGLTGSGGTTNSGGTGGGGTGATRTTGSDAGDGTGTGTTTTTDTSESSDTTTFEFVLTNDGGLTEDTEDDFDPSPSS